MATMQKDFSSMKEDAKDTLQHRAGQIKDAASEKAEDVRAKVQEVGTNVRHMISDLKSQANDMCDKTEKVIHKWPFISAGTAFMGGVLVALLMNRR